MHERTSHLVFLACLILPFGVLGADRTTSDETKNNQHLAARIKKEISKDDSLRPSSRRVEVTVQKGVITLKGTAQSDEESQAILGDAESALIAETPARALNSPEYRFDNQVAVVNQ